MTDHFDWTARDWIDRLVFLLIIVGAFWALTEFAKAMQPRVVPTLTVTGTLRVVSEGPSVFNGIPIEYFAIRQTSGGDVLIGLSASGEAAALLTMIASQHDTVTLSLVPHAFSQPGRSVP